MSQPVAGFSFTAVSGGVGTTVITDRSAVVRRVIVPGTYVGTLNIHDADSAAGTSATSQIVSFGLPALRTPIHVDLDVQCRKGITYQATGTPTLTIVWE